MRPYHDNNMILIYCPALVWGQSSLSGACVPLWGSRYQYKGGRAKRVVLVKCGLAGWARLRHGLLSSWFQQACSLEWIQGQYWFWETTQDSKSMLSWQLHLNHQQHIHISYLGSHCVSLCGLPLWHNWGNDSSQRSLSHWAAARRVDEPDCVHIKMAATTAANQLKLEEMESACTMLLFVEGFTIAALARTMASNGKSNMMCPSAIPSSPDWVVVG